MNPRYIRLIVNYIGFQCQSWIQKFFFEEKGGRGEIGPLSIVVGVVIVVNFSHFCLLQNQTLDKASMDEGNLIMFVQMKDHALFQWGENIEIAKIY